MKSINNYLFIVFYYFILLLLLASRQDAIVAPSMLIRILFMAAVIIPTIYDKRLCYPAIVSLFYTLTRYGFSYSFMPYTTWIYVLVSIVLLFVLQNYKNSRLPKIVWFFTLYLLLIDMFFGALNSHTQLFDEITYCFILLCVFILLLSKDGNTILPQFSVCITVTSLFLSGLFLLNMDQFTVEYGSGLERSGWTDPNYFSMVIGMGTIVSMIKMLGPEWKKIDNLEKALFLITTCLSLPAIILNASRGAAVSVTLSVVFLLIFSKVRFRYKTLFFIFAFSFLFFLYTNKYFELLEYRFQNDVGGGSYRSEIWASKLNAYSEGNILNLLFGFGHYGGVSITGINQGFHNDYIGFLVEYGLFGLFLFLYFLYYPVKIALKRSENIISVEVVILYICICCLTLEPFSIGSLAFFTFYLYALLLARNSRSYQNNL